MEQLCADIIGGQYIDPKDLQKDFDAVLMATGATKPFDPTGRNPGPAGAAAYRAYSD